MEPLTQKDYNKAVQYLEKVSAYNKLYYQRRKEEQQQQDVKQVGEEVRPKLGRPVKAPSSITPERAAQVLETYHKKCKAKKKEETPEQLTKKLNKIQNKLNTLMAQLEQSSSSEAHGAEPKP